MKTLSLMLLLVVVLSGCQSFNSDRPKKIECSKDLTVPISSCISYRKPYKIPTKCEVEIVDSWGIKSCITRNTLRIMLNNTTGVY